MTEDERIDNNAEQPLLTVAEFAKRVGKTERQVYRYIKTGRVQGLSPEQTGLSGVRLSVQELEKFLSETTGNWTRTQSAADGIGSSFESFEDSVEGMSLDSSLSSDDSSDERSATVEPMMIPLERHEAAVMRLGYLQSQYELSQRLLTEGSGEKARLAQQINDLQQELTEARERTRKVDELEIALQQAQQRVLEQANSDSARQEELLQKVKELESSLAQTEKKLIHSEAEAKVAKNGRIEAEGYLRQTQVAFQDKLQQALTEAQERIRKVTELEFALKQAEQRALDKETSDNAKQEELQKRVKELESSLARAEAKILHSEVEAKVANDNRIEAEGCLRQAQVRLQDAERRAERSWWQRLLGT